jgi:hypothetical protein
VSATTARDLLWPRFAGPGDLADIEQVPLAAAPRHVEIVDEIPHTAVGKPFKPELRRRAAEQAAKGALAGIAVHDLALGTLVDGRVEILIPRSVDDEAVRAALAAYAWSWRFV